MAKIKKENKLSDEQIKSEIKMLSDKAKETSSHQLDLVSGADLGDEDIDTGFEQRLAGTADPETSHRLYYTMRRTLMDNLPKWKKNERLRRYIYDEKSLFLNRGEEKNDNGYRGSDERMTYIDNFLETAFNVVNEWVRTGANPFDLYMAFYNLNEEKGFHKNTHSTTEQANLFDQQLKGLLNVPPPKKDK